MEPNRQHTEPASGRPNHRSRRFNPLSWIIPATSSGRKTLNVMLLSVVLPMLLLGLVLVNLLAGNPFRSGDATAFNTQEVDEALEHTLGSQAEALALIAADPVLTDNESPAASIGKRLEQLLQTYPGFESLALVSAEGDVAATAGILHQDFYLWQNTPAFQDSLNSRSRSSISPLKLGVLSLDESGSVDLTHSRIERLIFTAAVPGASKEDSSGGLVVGIMKSDSLINAVQRLLDQNPNTISPTESQASLRQESASGTDNDPEIQLLSLTPSEISGVSPELTTPDSIAIEGLAAEPPYTGLSPLEETGTSWYSLLGSLNGQQDGQFMGGKVSLTLALVSIMLALTGVWFMLSPSHSTEHQLAPAGDTPSDIQNSPVAAGGYSKKEVSRRLVAMQESVRREVADYLHGHVQSKLLALSMSLGNCQSLLEEDPDKAHQMLEHVQEELVKVQDEDLRQVSRELYPAIIKMGLVPAMRSLVGRFNDAMEIDLVIDADVFVLDAVGEDALPEKQRLGVYRIAEEALSNILKHAEAQHVEVTLIRNDSGDLVMSVTDDGIGFDPYDAANAQGLTMMTDYAEAIGGETVISSRLEAGTTVTLVVSLESAEPVLAVY